jgi:hypothetical protein
MRLIPPKNRLVGRVVIYAERSSDVSNRHLKLEQMMGTFSDLLVDRRRAILDQQGFDRDLSRVSDALRAGPSPPREAAQ